MAPIVKWAALPAQSGGTAKILRRAAAIFGLTCAMAALTAPAQGDPSDLCERSAILAAARTDVPISVLKAIMLTETGQQRNGTLQPWPWTVNMEGKGTWFDSEEAALAYAHEHFERGARSFDVGCFQINYKWHHQNFSSITAMFDPIENALYAARFLQSLFAEKGDWTAAAGAYHSRTPEFADRYAARFASFRADLLGEDALPLPETDAPESWNMAKSDALAARSEPLRTRINTYPLLQGGGAGSLGSLMPNDASSGASSLLRNDEAS